MTNLSSQHDVSKGNPPLHLEVDQLHSSLSVFHRTVAVLPLGLDTHVQEQVGQESQPGGEGQGPEDRRVM